MRYFTKTGYTYTAKNNYQKAILEYFKKLDRQVLDSRTDALNFKQGVLREIEYLNTLHPRCKALFIDTNTYSGLKGDLRINVSGLCEVMIYEEAKQ